MDPQLLLPPGAGLDVEQVQVCDEIVHLSVRCEAAGASCPKCGGWSEAFHISYQRNLANLPISGRQAVIDLRVRRFRCYQLACPRQTFIEQAPILAERYERAGCGPCSNRSASLLADVQEVGTASG